MSQQGLKQQAFRDAEAGAGTWNEDMMRAALGTVSEGKTANELLLAYAREITGDSTLDINGALQAWAESEGAYNWSSMGIFTTDFLKTLPGYFIDLDASNAGSLTLTGNDIDAIANLNTAGGPTSFTDVGAAQMTNQGDINGVVCAGSAGINKSYPANATFAWPTEGAIIVAARNVTLPTSGHICGTAATAPGEGFAMDVRAASNIRFRLMDGTTTHSNNRSGLVTANAPFIAAMAWDATNKVTWGNLNKLTAAHGLTFTGSSVTMKWGGAEATESFSFGNGDLGRMVFYNQGQTDADMETAINVLASRYLGVQFAATFNGTTDFYNRTTDLVGGANGTKFTASFWVDFAGGDGTDMRLYHTNGSRVILRRNISNQIEIRIQDSGGSTLIQATTVSTQVAADGYHHYLVVCDGTSAKIYKDGILDVNVTTAVAGTYNLSRSDHGICASFGGANKINGSVADLWIAFDAVDNPSAFYGSPARPFLGFDGSNPGVNPIIYLDLAGGSNLGTGGAFIQNGSPTLGPFP